MVDNGTFNGSLLDNTEHHLAITRQGNLLSFYADGLLFGTRAIGGNPNITTGVNTRIGLANNGSNALKGDLSDIRIWDDARTAAEILTNYNSNLSGTEANLLANWKMNEGTGQTLVDQSSNNNDATLGSSSGADASDPAWNVPGAVVNSGTLEVTAGGFLLAAGNTANLTVNGSTMSFNTFGSSASFIMPFPLDFLSPLPVTFTLVNGTTSFNSLSRTIGNKTYEQTNHLGNVNVTLSDRKKLVGAEELVEVCSSLEFNGIDQEATVTHSPSLLIGASDFTIEAMIKVGTQLESFPTILSKRSGINGFALRVGSSGRLVLTAQFNNISPALCPDLRDNLWHHVAVSRTGSAYSFYVDGVFCQTIISISADLSNAGAIKMGGEDGFNHLIGLIDEARVWNVARSALDIGANSSTSLLGTETGLVGYWKFDEGTGDIITDATANGNDGFLGAVAGIDPADALWSTDVQICDDILNMETCSSLDFDGVDDYIVVPDDPSLLVSTGVTMEAWVYYDGNAPFTNIIMNKEGEYQVGIIPNNLTWSVANTTPGWSSIGTGINIPALEWTHIAISVGATTASTYINGVLQHQIAASGLIGDVSGAQDELQIGHRQVDPTNLTYFHGNIDEVRVWNLARTGAEIAASYNLALSGNETGLVAYYRFNEGQGTMLNDLTVNGNNGSFSGNPIWSTDGQVCEPVFGVDTDFSTGLEGWVGCNGSNLTVVNQELKIEHGGGPNICAQRFIGFETGKTYNVSIDVVSGTTSGWTFSGGGNTVSLSLGSNSFSFVSGNTSNNCLVFTTNGAILDNLIIDNFVITEGVKGLSYVPDVKSFSDYYPFGSLLPGRNGFDADGPYRFGFNGMEQDPEVKNNPGNSYDFGARMYDPRSPRWWSPDPYAAVYPGVSPYAFALNTPIQAVDPDGNLVIFVNGYTQGGWGVLGIFGNRPLTDIGKKNYWDGLDDKFSERIGDDNRYYSDGGTRTAWSTARERYNQGMQEGKSILKKINAGDIKIEVDENGNPTETIKIVSHSQGSARAAGISSTLTEAGYRVEVEYNIAPKQPGDIPETNADRKVQYGSKKDMIAPQSPMSGDEVEQSPFPGENDGPIDGHLIKNYKKVLDVKKGRRGYVAPRKDKPAPDEGGMGLIQIVLLVSIFLGSCKGNKKRKECLKTYLTEVKQTKRYESISTNLRDSLYSWADLNVRLAKNYKSNKYEWKMDGIVFNSTKDRLFGWILDKDLDKEAVFDYVEYFVAEKQGEQWQFYLVSMPSMPITRAYTFDYLSSKEKNTPFTFEELSEIAIHEAVEGGLIKNRSCEINDDYINGWFDRKGRNLPRGHQKFLRDTVQ